MNELKHEKSPYLLQHQNNPVHWMTWGEKAFEKARRENKPIFLSIGYSTCHWCHVMARESFENNEIAEVLNRSYVSIKVDREERPDVDAIYMAALLALTGSGGWPLSAWLLPDGRPFFTGTYFPPTRFLPLLQRIETLWRDEQSKLTEDAEKFKAALEFNLLTEVNKTKPSVHLLSRFDENFETRFDENFGGFSGAPKFPQSMSLMTIMRSDLALGATRAREFVQKTLEGMTSGGLLDQVEGGFHRYCVDADWSVPHFEKMLYDQAWLSMALFEASQFLAEPSYKKIAEDTLRFVKDQLTDPGGGFYSAIDAESVNPQTGKKQEGFYFTYSKEELDGAEEALKVGPELDGRIVMQRPPDSIPIDWERLRRIRAQHPRPHRDEKIIAAWNGWMIAAFCKGYEVTGEIEWLKTAQNVWNFIQKNLVNKKGLARRWSQGDASIAGVSEDYAALVLAGLALHQSTLNDEYLYAGIHLQREMIERFWSEEQAGFLLSDGTDKSLILRFQQESDGVSPTTNSLSASNLLKLSFLTADADFGKKCDQLFERQTTRFSGNPLSLPYFGVALAEHERLRKIQIEKPGAETLKLREKLKQQYQPFVLLTKESGESESFAVCTRERCLDKVKTAAEALERLD